MHTQAFKSGIIKVLSQRRKEGGERKWGTQPFPLILFQPAKCSSLEGWFSLECIYYSTLHAGVFFTERGDMHNTHEENKDKVEGGGRGRRNRLVSSNQQSEREREGEEGRPHQI